MKSVEEGGAVVEEPELRRRSIAALRLETPNFRWASSSVAGVRARPAAPLMGGQFIPAG